MGAGVIFGSSARLHYIVFGEGEEVLLAFHGFGGSAVDIRSIEKQLSKRYKVYSFDLFHHGKSEYTGSTLSKDDFKEIINNFLRTNQIEKFSVLGYSLGGKIAFTLIELFPERIINAFLFAPDGLKENRIYNFITDTIVGRRVYQYITEHPGILFSATRYLRKMKVLDRRLYQFILSQTNSEMKRRLILDVWTTFRNINPDRREIQKLINRYDIKLQMIFGKYDRLIHFHLGEQFVKGLTNQSDVKIYNTGHKLVNERIATMVWG